MVPFLLAFWCVALFAYGLDAGPVYRTESLRAIIGAECLRGHWLFPVLYGEPFLTKPPGQYVAIGICSLPFGEVTAATARIPSVIAATAAVLIVAGMFRRVLGERAGWLAGFLLPTSVLWLDKVPSAEIDMTLLGWVTASLVFFHRAIDSKGPRLGWLIASLICLAGGTLTKWTAPSFFVLTVVPLLAWRGELRMLLQWRFLLAACLAVLVFAVWIGAVANEIGWSALVDTIRKEASYRFQPKANKGYPWGGVAAYPLLVLTAHLPLSLFALATLRRSFFARFDERGKLLLQFLHCWTWPSLLFWTLVPNHNVRYALPLSPGLMGLGVMGLMAFLANPKRQRGGSNGEITPSEFHISHPITGTPALPLGVRQVRLIARTPALPLGVRQVRLIAPFLALWLVVKIVFVEVVVPHRKHGDAPAIAAELREIIPRGETVHLFHLKDEGVMFYYARPAKRCRDWKDAPPGAHALFVKQEWETHNGHVELVRWMYDQQGDPLIVVKFH